jgi:hypothetical protein
LFAMWLFTNPAVTQVHFHATDTTAPRTTRARTGWACCFRRTAASRRSPRS